MVIRFAMLSAFVLAASGCARPDPVVTQLETDPAVAQAVIAPILTDPDLVSLDNRFAVMSDPGPLDGSLPPDDFAPETVAAARAEARALIGGVAGVAVAQGERCDGCNAVFLAERSAVLDRACAVQLQDDLAWALRLPDDLPVYPKSHLREAAGSQSGACSLRGASFTAPVAADQVLAFYRAIAAKAGFSLSQAGADGLIGTRGSSRMAVIVRPLPGGLSQFDLIATD